MTEKGGNDDVSLKGYMGTRYDHLEDLISNMESHMESRFDNMESHMATKGEVNQMSERITDLRYMAIGAIGGPMLVLVLTVVLKIIGYL